MPMLMLQRTEGQGRWELWQKGKAVQIAEGWDFWVEWTKNYVSIGMTEHGQSVRWGYLSSWRELQTTMNCFWSFDPGAF